MKFIRKLFGERGPSALAELIAQGREHLYALTSAHQAGWRFGEDERWEVDQDDCLLRFHFSDGVVAECPAQIIGTFNSDDESWLWAWANSSVVAEMKTGAEKLRSYGEEKGFERLVEAKWSGTETDAWDMAAVACLLLEAQGAYRGPTGSTYVFMTFGEVRLSQPAGGS